MSFIKAEDLSCFCLVVFFNREREGQKDKSVFNETQGPLTQAQTDPTIGGIQVSNKQQGCLFFVAVRMSNKPRRPDPPANY